MQGSFALRPDPFAGVAELAGIAEDEVMERVQYLLDKRIIREVTPIFDTRALGYSLDAGRGQGRRRATRTAPRSSSTRTRASRTTTCATTSSTSGSRSRSSRTRKLGLDGTLDVMAAKTGAESIRQLPTLKLFKIRMDLEMEGGTDALKTAGEAVEPMELDPIELSRRRHRRSSGPRRARWRCARDAYVPAAEKLGVPVSEVLARLESLRERGGLRRVAAILYHRRAGFSANGMGVWAVPDGEILDTGRRMAAFRGISHCYQRPTYADWPYSVFTMAHGRSKEECDAVLDAIAEHDRDRASARRCTRAPSSRRSGCSISPTTSSAGKQEHGS